MRHRVKTRNLSRTGAHRRAMARNMACALIEHERIETTLVKAKAMRPFVEKLVTLSRNKTLHNYRRALSLLGNQEDAVNKLFNVLGPRFASRPGGYTRILKLAKPRLGDKADRAYIEFVERSEKEPTSYAVDDDASAGAKNEPAEAAAAAG